MDRHISGWMCVPWGLSKKIHKDEQGAMVFICFFFLSHRNLSPKFTTFEDQVCRETLRSQF